MRIEEIEAIVARAATRDEPQTGSPLPNWAKRLPAILAAVKHVAPTTTAASAPMPFEGLFVAVVARAQRQLARMTGAQYHEHWSLRARDDLGRSLLRRLSVVAGPALLSEFDLFRHFARATTPDGAMYDAFIADMRERLAELILEQPVLGRMIGTVVDNWLRATSELVRALANDAPALTAMFAGQQELGPVAAISCDLSDPHRGGRTVAILEFASGAKLVYKPKSLRLDQRWGEFLDWLRAAGAPIDLQSARVLAHERHGWAEFIAAEPAGAAAPLAYYRRAGALLALLYMVQARDIHAENVARRGDQPILLDLETLFHPHTVAAQRDWPSDDASTAALEQLNDSVAATLYLPLWVAAPPGKPIAVGGLSGVPPAQARPDNVAALCRGFTEVYRYFQANARMLAAGDGPVVRHFAGVTIRAVFKPTTAYQRQLRLATRKVSRLHSGAAWSAQFGDHHETAISAAERRSLANLDVPFFSAVTDALAVEADGETIAGCFTATPLSQVLDRVRTLSTGDLDFQLALITASIRLGAGAQCPVWPQAAIDRAGADYRTRAIAACRDIARTLERSAVRRGDGAAWLGIVPVDHDREAVSVIGTDLYSGSIGVALFLAAFARITEDGPSRDLASAAIASALRIQASPGALARLTIGGGFGIASVIYGLVRLADLLDRPGLLDQAIALSREIGTARIAADRSHDLLRGSAGAILGLLALHGARPEPDLVERAIWCGEQLMAALAARRLEPGAAFALARLWQATGQARFRDVAVGAWAGASEPALPCEPWCRGAVGHGLAAIGLRRSEVAADLQLALDAAIATAGDAASFDDSLCCGRAGGIELLIEAGRTLDRPDLVTLAQRTAAAHLFPAIVQAHCFRPGLFRGLSGVGYTLLRSIDPELLPCLLLWDVRNIDGFAHGLHHPPTPSFEEEGE